MNAFQEFYADLYKADKNSNSTKVVKFLDRLHLPTLTDNRRAEMDAPISIEEVSEVIKALKGRTAPGPDGFSMPYYKAFSEILTPYLTRFFNSMTKGSPIGNQLNMVYISVIPKPGKDASQIGNYIPISLINKDLKILTKVLANRLASFIGLYIHKDQDGFIPGLQGPDQVRRAVDLITILKSGWEGGHKQEGMLLSLVLQKAFELVSWPYLFVVLRHWGFGPNILGILEALYSTPEARIRPQGLFFNPITIARGVRDAPFLP